MGFIIDARKKRFADVWLEKYRPDSLDMVVMNDSYKKKFKQYIKDETVPSLLLVGAPGTGKTTLAYILLDSIIKDDLDFLEMNGSLFRGIDVVRGLSEFIKSMTMSSKKKIIFIDEADKLTPDAQDSLRNMIEQNSDHLSFIFTANYMYKITEALQSRLQTFTFKQLPPSDQLTFIYMILEKEKVVYKKEDLDYIVKATMPDMRKCLNEMNKVIFEEADKKILSLDKATSDFLIEQRFVDLCIQIVEKHKASIPWNEESKLAYEMIYGDTMDYVSMFEKINLAFKYVKVKTLSAHFCNELARIVSPKMLAIEFFGEFLNFVFGLPR